MTWRIEGPERNLAPEDFQEQLTYIGGTNKYDEPNFVIWWGQYAYGPGSFRAGGVWTVDSAYFKGYRDLLKGSGEPCWCLGQWNPPELYGSPEGWYVVNFDESTGLQQLGEFAYSGRYEILYNLRWHEMVDGKLILHAMPLNPIVFDVVAQIVQIAKDISIEKTKAAYLAAKALEDEQTMREVERHLQEKAVPFAGSTVSFTRQGIRSTTIDAKMRRMQQKWSQLANSAKQFSRPGLQTR